LLTHLTNLQNLCLYGPSPMDFEVVVSCSELTCFSTLKSLTLIGVAVYDLPHLRKLTTLESLIIDSPHAITTSSLSWLSLLTNLTYLHWDGQPWWFRDCVNDFHGQQLIFFNKLVHLKYLIFPWFEPLVTHAHILSQMTWLHKLVLARSLPSVSELKQDTIDPES